MTAVTTPSRAEPFELTHSVTLPMHGPVVLAVHAHPSPATLQAAKAIAFHLDVPVQVIAVLEPLPMLPMGDGVTLVPLPYDEGRELEFDAEVRHQLERAWANDVDWQLQVISGNPAQVIVEEARKRNASLIVMGKGKHAPADRLFGGEITLRVTMLSTIPVLGVAPTFTHAPRSAVVGVDFSVSSLLAARAALALLEPTFATTSALHLVHVRPQTPIGSVRWEEDYDNAVRARFDRFIKVATGAMKDGIEVHTHIVDGPAVDSLLETVVDTKTDLLAVGTRGPGWWERLFVGSTATAVLRRAPDSVLIAPPPAALERIRLELALDGRSTLEKSSDWSEALVGFTDRNRGRRARLEIVDPVIGHPTVLIQDYRFTGATYEPRSRRVTLMMSDESELTQHLTHTISAVQSIDLVACEDGRDKALLIEDSRGHAVLTFTQVV